MPALLALEQAQRMSASILPTMLLLAAVAVASLFALLHREQRAAFPLLPIGLLRQPTIWRSDALAACHGATLVSLVSFLPLYLRVVRGSSASETGLLLLPLMFGIGAGSMITGRIVSRTGLTAIFPSVGLIFATLALVVFALWADSLHGWPLGTFLFLIGLFMGTVMGVVQVTVQNAAGPASLGSAAASVQLSRSIGAAAGTALVGTVLFASLALSDPDAAAAFRSLVDQGPAAIADLSADRRAMLQSEIARAFRAAFLTIAPLPPSASRWPGPSPRGGFSTSGASGHRRRSMKFYDCATAPSPRRVRIFLAEKGIGVPTVQVDLRNGEHLQPAFRKINPDCTVPALELDNGTVINDAIAICHYFEELHPEPPLIGRTPEERAVTIAWNRRIERDGFYAVMEAFRNSTPGLKGRAIPGPDDYEQIPALAERGRARVAASLPPWMTHLGDARIRCGPALLDCRYHRADHRRVCEVGEAADPRDSARIWRAGSRPCPHAPAPRPSLNSRLLTGLSEYDSLRFALRRGESDAWDRTNALARCFPMSIWRRGCRRAIRCARSAR